MARSLPIISSLAAAAVALAMGAPASAADADGWEILPNGKTCTMLSTYEDDVSVGLISTGASGDVSFMTAGESLENIAGAPGAIVTLHVKFDGPVEHADWTDEMARVVDVGNHRVAVIADWGPEYSRELAQTLGASGKATISIGAREIGSYNISGGRAAAEELMRCGTSVAAR
jgi:hypothetical protein